MDVFVAMCGYDAMIREKVLSSCPFVHLYFLSYEHKCMVILSSCLSVNLESTLIKYSHITPYILSHNSANSIPGFVYEKISFSLHLNSTRDATIGPLFFRGFSDFKNFEGV